MAAHLRTLDLDAARRHVEELAFAPVDGRAGGPRVGVEVEWLVVDLEDERRAVDFPRVRAIGDAAPRPGRSRVTFEPGGQLELSSMPAPDVTAAIGAVSADAAALSTALGAEGLGLVGVGLDPQRTPRRVVDSPRYRAMETYFDADGPRGRTMMCATAAVQVNLDAGEPAEVDVRWRRAHAIGPVLAAAFANSPFTGGMPSGYRSTRLMVWLRIDPGRTSPVAGRAEDGRAAWARYALDARVMLIRTNGDAVAVRRPLPFRRWVVDGHELGYPTVDDLDYHLTTLFPPIRPRGWIELRMLDALPDPWWRVAAAVTAAVLDDPAAAAAAARHAEPVRDRWRDAARHGLAHPALAAAAHGCFDAALEALERSGAGDALLAAVASFQDRYVARGRCPADDRLDAWARDGVLLPVPDRFSEPTWV